MDHQKDNKTLPAEAVNKSSVELFFKDNTSLLFVYKKTERIVSALHLVTNLFLETEPLRQAIREKALCLLPALLTHASSKSAPYADFTAIVSYLGVARDAGFISTMNYQVITREIESVIELLQNREMKADQKLSFSNSFFQVGLPLPKIEKPSPAPSVKDMSYKGQNNVFYDPIPKKSLINENGHETAVKDIKANRRQKILAIVKEKKVCSIKDFSYVITEFSEKTLQRELGALVAEGVLKKEGKKRWSTYSFAVI